MLRVLVLAMFALASGFTPLAAPLSVRPVAASPAGAGISMIREHRRRTCSDSCAQRPAQGTNA